MEAVEVGSQTFVLNHDTTPPRYIREAREVLSAEKRVIMNVNGTHQHLNYLSYLELCWANHYSIVLKPDHIWQILLTEIATHIKNNAEKYRHLFTDSNEKKEITVSTADPYVLPLHEVTKQLKDLVPVGTEDFLLNFTTSTEMSRFAFNAAFCDAMSPYYSYSMLMCAFPKIRVEGTEEDWTKMLTSIKNLRTFFELSNYFTKVENNIKNIISALQNNDGEIFKTMFTLVRCGSGSQTELDGWIKDFFNLTKAVRPGYVSNYPTATSIVEYKNLSTGKEYVMRVGLFSSSFDENQEFLLPEYGYAVYEK